MALVDLQNEGIEYNGLFSPSGNLAEAVRFLVTVFSGSNPDHRIPEGSRVYVSPLERHVISSDFDIAEAGGDVGHVDLEGDRFLPEERTVGEYAPSGKLVLWGYDPTFVKKHGK